MGLVHKFFTICAIALCSSSIQSVLSQLGPEDLIYNAGELGILRGHPYETIVSKRPIIQLKGIPYVQSTSGAGRFLPPQPVNVPLSPVDAEGRFDATHDGPCCPQVPLNFFCSWKLNEDCLRMNIYTPQVQSTMTTLFPVIVFIHGGSFTGGSADFYNGNRFLERDVVVVNFNYRLGVLGFFNLNNEGAPGNAGLYDMVEALRFIKTHIHHFGGDPERVTILGHSAGSAAVTQLLVSPLIKDEGLFHRAIAMSGSALNEWGTTTSADAERASLDVARLVGCYDPAEPLVKSAVITCMRSVTHDALANQLGLYQMRENSQGRLGFGPASPSIQTPGGIGSVPVILDQAPETILEAGQQSDVPLMMGGTRHDGSFILATVYNNYLKLNGLEENEAYLRNRFVSTVLEALGIEDRTGAIHDMLATTYIGAEAMESGNFTVMTPGLTDLHTVYFLKEASFRTLEHHSRLNNNSYWYDFDHRGQHTTWGIHTTFPATPVRGGIAHGDDLIYIFTIPLGPENLNTEDLAVSNRLVNYWVNFAYTGNPNIAEDGDDSVEVWAPYSEDFPSFVKIQTAQDEAVAGQPGEHWVGVSNELFPELQPGYTTPAAETTSSEPEITSSEPETTTTGQSASTSEEPGTTPAGSLINAASFIVLSITSLFIALNN